jgi:beta-lysine 5,6-aminomutase alpha subunit
LGTKTKSKLGLNPSQIARARALADRIVDKVLGTVRTRTTVTVERAILRLYGVDGVDEHGVPLPNRVVEKVKADGVLDLGVARLIGAACGAGGGADDPQDAAQALARGKLKPVDLAKRPLDKALEAARALTNLGVTRIRTQRVRRVSQVDRLGITQGLQLYLIVATGNIYEDASQAQAAVRQGADIIAVIRTTGQSLLDFVPHGATTEGFGGTYATQENFRIMREALDEVGHEVGRYIQLTNYASGLCMPEIAVMGAFERLDMMLNDSMYGILFRDINMQRTFVDQYFSRMINAFAGVVINTGEDNYLTTADAVEAAHTVLASQFINERFGLRAGLRAEQLGLGHAFEIDPQLEDGFLMELAQAQMAREIFPDSPLKYMPPTKFMSGNIFRGHVMDALFNLASVTTGQSIHLLGMLTEALHTPHLADRYLAVENARYVMNTARHLGEELSFVEGGRIRRRAAQVLGDALELLQRVEKSGLMAAIEAGTFACIQRTPQGGKGFDGVVEKHADYVNPFEERFQRELPLAAEEVAHARS